jgi:hypothetical protein
MLYIGTSTLVKISVIPYHCLRNDLRKCERFQLVMQVASFARSGSEVLLRVTTQWARVKWLCCVALLRPSLCSSSSSTLRNKHSTVFIHPKCRGRTLRDCLGLPLERIPQLYLEACKEPKEYCIVIAITRNRPDLEPKCKILE